MSQYRDGLAGLVAQVEAKRVMARDRRARIEPAVYGMLPPDLAREIEDLEAAMASTAADFAGLTATDAALDALIAACDRALDLAPSLGRSETALPEFAPPAAPAPWLIEERRAVQYRDALSREAAAAFGEMEVTRWGDHAYVGRASDGDVPFVRFARLAPLRPTYDSSFPS